MAINYAEYATSGEFQKFAEVGDQVAGVLTKVEEGKDFNNNPCPVLYLEIDSEGTERIVSASQVMLKQALAEHAPQVGDKVRITYSGVGDAKPGKAPAKLFTVEVKRGPFTTVAAQVTASVEDPF